MSKTVRLILAFSLVIISLFGEKILEVIKDNVEIINTPSVDIAEPNLTYKTLVKDIVDIDIEKQDAKQISDFFLELSEIVWTDPGFLNSTGTFREFNMKSGGLNFAGLELKNKYPSLGEEIDEVVSDTVGLEDVALTDEKRKSLRDCLAAIAWGVHQ